jgi:hypothetical protein
MLRLVLVVAVALAAVESQAAVSNSPFSGAVHIEVDQPAGWFTHAKTAGDASWLAFENQHFFADNGSLWLARTNGVGSLHSLDLDPLPTYVAIHTGPAFSNGTQEFGYEYFYAPMTRSSSSARLPVAAGLVVVPEPATLSMSAISVLCIAAFRRLRSR